MSLDKYRRRLKGLVPEYNSACATVKSEKKELRRAQRSLQHCKQAQEALQQIAAGVQESAHSQIASVVSRCLETIFEDPYEFVIHFEKKRGKTEARLTFMRNGNEVDPKSAAGGGVVDVAAFALRLSALSLRQPQLRPLLVMDEPFKWVHPAGRREQIQQLLNTLSKELSFQFLIVTGIDDLKTGTIVDLD